MYFIEYSDNYSKTSENLWQDYRDEPVWTHVGAIANCNAANNSAFNNAFKINDR